MEPRSRSSERRTNAELARAMELRDRRRRRVSPATSTTLDRSRDAGDEAAALLANVAVATAVSTGSSTTVKSSSNNAATSTDQISLYRGRRGRDAITQRPVRNDTTPEVPTTTTDHNSTSRMISEQRRLIPKRSSTSMEETPTIQSDSNDHTEKTPAPKLDSTITDSADQVKRLEHQEESSSRPLEPSKEKKKPRPKPISYPQRTSLRPLLEKIPIRPPILRYHSPIHLLPKCNPHVSLACSENNLSLQGKRLGRSNELWAFEPTSTTLSSPWVSYGDTVRIVNTDQQQRISCVRNENRNGALEVIVANDSMDTWTIHAARETIPVGQPLLESPARSTRRPVHMGDSIVLRHSVHHGVVVVPSFLLATDAHGQETVAEPSEEDDYDIIHRNDPPTAMTRLHRAHRLVPDTNNLWLVDQNALIYRNASHLWRPHERRYNCTDQEELDATLFRLLEEKDDDVEEEDTSRTQEQILVSELIGACMGLDGAYIQADATRHPLRFVVVQPLDTVISRSLVQDCLEIPAAYAILRRFLAQPATTRYRQALAEQLNTAMEDHVRTVLLPLDDDATVIPLAELHRKLLQDVLPVVTEWVQAAASGGGGQENRFVQAATAPYRQQLSDWLERGVLPTQQQEHGDGIIRAVPQREWTERYGWAENEFCEAASVLDCLADERLAGQVLAAGRYWHAVRAATQRKETGPKSCVVGDLTPRSIQDHYKAASTALMKILFRKESGLLDTLRLVKGYWLLEYGDVFLEFMGKAQTELLKDVSDVSRNRLQHWMKTCCAETAPICRLAATEAVKTPHKQAPPKVVGIDAFVIDLPPIPFPASLVLSRRAVERYQQIFRHLFFVRFVKWRLVSVWRDQQNLKQLVGSEVALGPTFLLRQRMVHFLENILHYMVAEVIDPQWLQFQTAIGQSDLTVDVIYNIHNDFQESVLEACFLVNRDLARSLNKLLKTCLLFSDQMQRFREATQPVIILPTPSPLLSARERLEHSNRARVGRTQSLQDRVTHEVESPSFQRMMGRFEHVWSQHLNEFVSQLTSSSTHNHLMIRLDFNGYVTQVSG